MTTLSSQPADAVRPAMDKRIAYTLAASVALTAAADWLFYGETVGWTTGLFALALLLAILGRDIAVLRQRNGTLIALAALALCFSLIDSPGPLQYISAGLALVTLAYIGTSGWTVNPFAWCERWCWFLFTGWASLFRDVPKLSRAGIVGRAMVQAALWGIPLALGAVFIALFAAANPIIEQLTHDALDAINRFLEHIDTVRVLFWIYIAAWSWGLLRTVAPEGMIRNVELGDEETQDPPIPAALIERCLLVFNVVFALQTALDLIYLTGGSKLPDGFTWKEYAHRGAYPLVATALLAIAFVLITFRSRATGEHMKWARRFVYLFIAQNILLVGSSMWRLYLLVDISMITRWRVAAGIWMVLVAACLVLIILRIVRDQPNRWFTRRAAALAALIVFACCFIPFDSIITQYNARYCVERTGDKDGQSFYVPYHESLGPDALPAMIDLLPTVKNPTKAAEISDAIFRLKAKLAASQSTWHGWTWTNQRLSDAINPVAPKPSRLATASLPN